jgi:hypothetical protein
MENAKPDAADSFHAMGAREVVSDFLGPYMALLRRGALAGPALQPLQSQTG